MIKVIFKMKRSCGYNDADKKTMSMTASAIYAADQDNALMFPSSLANWILIFDEFADWFLQLTTLQHLQSIYFNKQMSTLDSVMFSVIGHICSQIIGIRRLVVAGLDVQAKQLLRVLSEYLDVAVLLSKGGPIVADFQKTSEPVEANKFWHTYVARGKARKAFHHALRNNLPPEAYKEVLDFEEDENLILGSVIHPSLIASQMALIPRAGDEMLGGTIGPFGQVTQFSVRTLSYATYRMIVYVLSGYTPPLVNHPDNQDANNTMVKIAKQIEAGKVMLPKLLLHTFLEAEKIPYLQPTLSSMRLWFPEEGSVSD